MAGYSDAFYQSIEIAVGVTGQQGISDLQANAAALSARIDAMRASMQSLQYVAQADIQALQDLTREFLQAQEAVAAANRVFEGGSARMGEVGKSGQAAARGVLELSRGLEDLSTGGFLGILNNIPGIFSNLGTAVGLAGPQLAALTAVVSGLGTAAYVLYKNWDQVEQAFQKTEPSKLIAGVKELNEELKKLTEKEYKTAVDYSDIDILTKKIDAASAAQATLNRLRTGQTEAEQKRGKVVSEAITEGGGLEPLQRAVQSLMAVKATRETEILREQVKGYTDLGMGLPVVLRDKLKASEDADKQRRDQAADDIITQAARGSEMHRAKLQQMFERAPQVFEAQGVDMMRFGAGLEQAAPGELFAAERRKLAETSARESAAAAAKRDTENAAQTRLTMQINDEQKKAHDDAVQDLDEHHDRLRREAATEEGRAKTARETAVGKMAGRFGGGYDEGLETVSLRHQAMGADEAGSAALLRPQLQRKLRGKVPADMVAEVAEIILQKAMDKVTNEITEESAKHSITPRQAAARLSQVAEDKFTAADMADERRAGAGGRAAQQQQNEMKRAYMAQLKTQALMESALGYIGDATMELSQIEANNQMLAAGIRRINGNMNRQVNRAPTLMPRGSN